MDIFVEIVGWFGAACLLLAFYLNSRNVYPATSVISLVINVLGAVGLLINGLYHGALPSVGLNGIWIFVGATALYKALRAAK